MTNPDDDASIPLDGAEDELADAYAERVVEQRPSEEEQQRLLQQHEHHLIRYTEATHTDTEEIQPGVEGEYEITVEDAFCFTCGEWVGLSGVDLRGRPRSRKEAFYYRGPSEAVAEARQEVRDTLADLSETIVATVPHVETAEEALAFIRSEREQAEQRLAGDGDRE